MPKFSDVATEVLNKRYFRRNEHGEIIEDWEGLVHRVVSNVIYGKSIENNHEVDTTTYEYKKFYDLLYEHKFLPNSPTLFNAGISGTLSGCFFIEPEDTMESIMKIGTDSAIIQKFGGGVGFNFSNLRPIGDFIKTTHGKSCGIVSVMETYSQIGDMITQAGKRDAALMGLLRVDHPEILSFIKAKKESGVLSNINISVVITKEFIDALYSDSNYDLKFEGTVYKRIKAKTVWNQIISNAHKSGDPGIMFEEEVQKMDVLKNHPELKITGVNPCGEQVLENKGSCTLGSINLYELVDENGILDEKELKRVVSTAVAFLDKTIDVNKFPLKEIEETVKKARKIGLGVMGFADMLMKMKIKYGSTKSFEVASDVMEKVQYEALRASCNLAKNEGACPVWDSVEKDVYEEYRNRAVEINSENQSKWDRLIIDISKYGLRNVAVTTLAPTGTIGLIANVSGGIEPYFGVVHRRKLMGDKDAFMIARFLDDMSEKWEITNDELDIIDKDGIQACKKIPKEYRSLFTTASEIPVNEHIIMQSKFQNMTSNAISKTINMSSEATVADVDAAYRLGYETKCKGLTVFRDGCKGKQVLTKSGSKSSEMPDYLPAHRIKFNTPKGSAYIMVSELEGIPSEIFVFPPDKVEINDEEAIFMETICRLISVSIRNTKSLKKYIQQLSKSNKRRGYANQILAYIEKIMKSENNYDVLLNLHIVPEDRLQVYSIYNVIKLGMETENLTIDEVIKELKRVNKEHGHVSSVLNFVIMGVSKANRTIIGTDIETGEVCPECGEAELIHTEDCVTCPQCLHVKCG